MDSRIVRCYEWVPKVADALKAINVIGVSSGLLGIISFVVSLVCYLLAYESKWLSSYFLHMAASSTDAYRRSTSVISFRALRMEELHVDAIIGEQYFSLQT